MCSQFTYAGQLPNINIIKQIHLMPFKDTFRTFIPNYSKVSSKSRVQDMFYANTQGLGEVIFDSEQKVISILLSNLCECQHQVDNMYYSTFREGFMGGIK